MLRRNIIEIDTPGDQSRIYIAGLGPQGVRSLNRENFQFGNKLQNISSSNTPGDGIACIEQDLIPRGVLRWNIIEIDTPGGHSSRCIAELGPLGVTSLNPKNCLFGNKLQKSDKHIFV